MSVTLSSLDKERFCVKVDVLGSFLGDTSELVGYIIDAPFINLGEPQAPASKYTRLKK